ncbi:unnamed protein product [Ilex paraguariensis]|uniref:ABC1 atypical kinase-like domain-containing protein n=1 Tax=Ilex paraguariensis TaxID=185542 RepID=A0ABC8UWW0_9AQUA
MSSYQDTVQAKIFKFSSVWIHCQVYLMGWGNIYRRRMRVFTLAIVIYMDYKALQQREKWMSKTKRADLWQKAHERNAKRVLNLMIALEGLWVKLGQYLSTRADVLPEPYICLLKQLQDSLPPRPLEEVCQTIQKELGKSMDDLFLNFDKIPLATASIAQVHRATLTNGQEVVVKVQHEGVKTIILEDLKNAKSIVDWIAWAEPQYNFNPMIDEWCKESPKELDFNNEAENTRTVSRNLGCSHKCDEYVPANRVDVLIPEVILAIHLVIARAKLEDTLMMSTRSNDTIYPLSLRDRTDPSGLVWIIVPSATPPDMTPHVRCPPMRHRSCKHPVQHRNWAKYISITLEVIKWTLHHRWTRVEPKNFGGNLSKTRYPRCRSHILNLLDTIVRLTYWTKRRGLHLGTGQYDPPQGRTEQ